MMSELMFTCRKCHPFDDTENVHLHLDIDGATCDRDNDHLTFYHDAECETCGKQFSVVEYARVYSVEVEE
tara:strand:- start:92 stop:301 length:210 start_codon:yes stop_codon:yes gene_type:complete